MGREGRTDAKELRIEVCKQTPSNLFQLLWASVLFSVRIDASIATEAARNLKRRGCAPQAGGLDLGAGASRR